MQGCFSFVKNESEVGRHWLCALSDVVSYHLADCASVFKRKNKIQRKLRSNRASSQLVKFWILDYIWWNCICVHEHLYLFHRC